jgi:hypothetical protein
MAAVYPLAKAKETFTALDLTLFAQARYSFEEIAFQDVESTHRAARSTET